MRFTAWSILWIVPVLAGCQTPTVTVRRDPVQYTVSVVKLTTSEQGRSLLEENPDARLPAVLKRRDTELKEYPPVYLLPGETQEVDRQKRVDFQTPLTPDGKSQGMQHDTVGELVRASLDIEPKAGPQVHVEVDDARLTGWQTLTLQEGQQRVPVIGRDGVATTLQPVSGKWVMAGAASAGEGKFSVFLVRLDPPGRAPGPAMTNAEEEDFTSEAQRTRSSEEENGRVRME